MSIQLTALKTPGVYIDEVPSFPPSVAQVATAIPAFIGYTQKASDASGNSLVGKPTRITSMLDYTKLFGGGQNEANLSISIAEVHDSTGKFISANVNAAFTSGQSAASGAGKKAPATSPPAAAPAASPPAVAAAAAVSPPVVAAIQTSPSPSTKYLMYYAMQAFFMNGGGDCYIVSVNTYQAGGAVSANDLMAGIDAVKAADEPTLLLFPDSQGIDTSANYANVINAALSTCASMKDRFTLVDLYDNSGNTDANSNAFRNLNISNNLNYGAAYYPNVISTFNYNYDENAIPVTVSSADGKPTITAKTLADLNNGQNSLVYNQAVNAIDTLSVILPPSPYIAGIITTVDSTRGVWKAPANIGLTGLQGLKDIITDDSQQNLNVDPVSGKSINAIRSFTGKGTLVWGARTLLGNDNDFRYVPVRRFYIMVETSVKYATFQYVFEPNAAPTWVMVQAMIENFLTSLWREGALAGAKPEQAFYVSVGLNKTMTFDDILEGRMIVEIGMAPVRPAEFIVLRFSQIQQQS